MVRRRNDSTVPAGPDQAHASPAGSPGTEAAPLRIGEILEDRYVVWEELGRGGGGRVYRALDRGTDLPVAIKVLEPQRWSAPLIREQLYRELRCGRAIQHPNVCRFHDVFETGGRWCLTMEYASGGTLRDSLAAGAERSLDQRLQDARAATAGLAAIHAAGMVHRDFKPENILRLGDGRLVVSDFGLARMLDQSRLVTTLAGTPGYLAPEVLAGGGPSFRSDVWSLGIVLHEIAFAARPEWRGAVPVLAAADGPDPALRALHRVCAACLELRPDRRPADGGQVARLLEAALRAPGRRPWYHRRAPRLAALAALVLGAAAVPVWRATRRPSPGAAQLDKGTDWSHHPIVTRVKYAQCLQVVGPGSGVVRMMAVLGRRGLEAVDLDLRSGQLEPVPLAREAAASRCPAWSRDGQSLVFSRGEPGDGQQIWLSRHPDGREAAPLVEGQRAVWLPSGRELAVVTRDQRLALSDLAGVRHVFSRGGPPPAHISALAVDDSGKQLAALAELRPAGQGRRESRLEIYDTRSTHLLTSRPIPSESRNLTFDPGRRSFQYSQLAPDRRWIWMEQAPDGTPRPLGFVPGADVYEGLRVPAGLLLTSHSVMRPLSLVDGDGASRPIGEGMGPFSVSDAGDVAFVRADRAGLQVALWRPGNGQVRIVGPGPRDSLPALSPDGQRLVYYRSEAGELVLCRLPGEEMSCATVHTDPSVSHVGLFFSPGGAQVAYLALDDYEETRTSVRILEVTSGRVRDLGRLETRCPLRWSSDAGLWVLVDEGGPWREIHATTSRPTGRTFRASENEPDRCDRPPPPAAPARYRVKTEAWMDFRLIPDPAAPGG